MNVKHVFGSVPVVRILEFMLDNPDTDYTGDELRINAQVRPVDIKRDFWGMVESGVVIETRRIRGVPLYELNKDEPVLSAMILLIEAIEASMEESNEPEGTEETSC